MIKEWATVVSWQNGQAVVSCDVKASCSSCASRAGCGSRVLNKLGPQTTHTIVVPSAEPLAPGQKVELGIAEKSLLGSALLVYMSPLAGLFLCAALFQMLFGSDLAALSGAMLGGVGGFLVARGYSRKLSERDAWQPVILNVALPPDLVRVETTSIETRQQTFCPTVHLPRWVVVPISMRFSCVAVFYRKKARRFPVPALRTL